MGGGSGDRLGLTLGKGEGIGLTDGRPLGRGEGRPEGRGTGDAELEGDGIGAGSTGRGCVEGSSTPASRYCFSQAISTWTLP